MAGTRTTIVCIDDNLEMLGLLNIVPHRPDYVVIGAMNGNCGLEMVRHHKPDLVLLDLSVPDTSGEQVYDLIKADAELEHIPVIIMTADGSDRTKYYWECIAKSDGFIVKPFSAHELRQVVTNVIAARPMLASQ